MLLGKLLVLAQPILCIYVLIQGFNPKEIAPGSHWTGDFVGLTDGLKEVPPPSGIQPESL